MKGRLLFQFCYSCPYKDTVNCDPDSCIMYQTHLAQEAKRCAGKVCKAAPTEQQSPIGKPIRWKKGNKPLPVALVKGLEHYATCELVEELKKREGVTARVVEHGNGLTISLSGPAVVLVVID